MNILLGKSIYIKEAITCLKANRLRSFLALLGLLIGTASVVALITIGFLAKTAALDQFKNLGTQKLLVHMNSESVPDYNINSFNNLILTNKTNFFNANIINSYHPLNNSFKIAYYQDIKLQSLQMGVTQSLFNSLKLKLASGRFISDHDKMRNFAVIGDEIVKQTDGKVKIGNNIVIDNISYIIVGILEHWPVDPLFSHDINHSILLPITTAQYISDSNINEIYFDVNEGISPTLAEKYLQSLLSKLLPGQTLQFTNAEQIIEQLEAQAQILTILLGTIGAISLLVGAIGVMNIMLVSIIERKTEIGIRMAIGATPYDIKIQFLAETICLAVIGGILGTCLGIIIPYVICYFSGWDFTLPISSIFLGLSISLGVGIISGYYPASKASKMLPVLCLHK